MKRYLFPTAALAGMLLLSGCSADSMARSQLSQAAGDAASSSRSAGLVLGLEQDDRLIPGTLNTRLSGSGETLAQQATTLTGLTATGGIGAERDRILKRVRAAQDAVQTALDRESAGTLTGAALDDLRTRLDALAQQLAADAKRLEKQ